MMETIKRHLFLAGLIVCVVVVSLAIGLTVYLAYMRPDARARATLRGTQSRAKELLSGALYTSELVDQLTKQVAQQRQQYDEILDFLRKLGAGRKPLVKGLFPVSTEIGLRHSFKAEYDGALARFMQRLQAITPVVEGKPGEAPKPEAEGKPFLMYAHPKASFFRADWVDKAEAPTMDLVRYGQENIWLQEDLVGILAKMNEDLTASAEKRTMAAAPIKELIEIRIGANYGVLAGTKMVGGAGRYLDAAAARAKPGGKTAGPRAPTLTGHVSDPGFYLVLPFRLTVVVESRHAGELLRRLKDTESFLTVQAWRIRPITEGTLERSRDLLAPSLDDYGRQPVVRLEVIGESLVFQLEGGRVTTMPKTGAPGPAPTPTPEPPA